MPTYFESDRGTYIPANREARANVTILSEELPPAEISRVLGIEADESWRKGDLVGHGRTGRRRSNHGWRVISPLGDQASTTEHLQAVIGRLSPAAAQLRTLSSRDGIDAKLWLVEHIENWNPGFWLSPDQLAALADLGIGVSIDVYVYEPGELAPMQIPRRVRRRETGE